MDARAQRHIGDRMPEHRGIGKMIGESLADAHVHRADIEPGRLAARDVVHEPVDEEPRGAILAQHVEHEGIAGARRETQRTQRNRALLAAQFEPALQCEPAAGEAGEAAVLHREAQCGLFAHRQAAIAVLVGRVGLDADQLDAEHAQ
jgi:hypothetical protein